MATKEERERRRQERLAAEQQELAAARRRLVFGYIAAGGLALAVVVGLVIVIASGGDNGTQVGGKDVPEAAHVQIHTGSLQGYDLDDRTGTKPPPLQQGDLATAARDAHCDLQLDLPDEGNTHIQSKSDAPVYKTNPPTSGNHNPTPAQDGFYRAGNSPPKENFVHTLEHGRIEFQYKPGTPAADVAKLRRLAEEPLNGTAGYHVLMFENNTKMPEQFAATAWTKSIACPTLSTAALAAMREFRAAFTDKGPELIP